MGKERGPYKLYKTSRSSAKLPTRTLRWRNARIREYNNQRYGNQSQHVEMFDNVPATANSSQGTSGLANLHDVGNSISLDCMEVALDTINSENLDNTTRTCSPIPCADRLQQIYSNASISLDQAVFLLLAFITMTGITDRQIQFLLDLLHIFLPPNNLLPKTLYLFREIIGTSDITKVLLCSMCRAPVGERLASMGHNPEATVLCKYCNANHNEKDLLDSKQFFIHIPMERQLRMLLQDLKLGALLGHRFEREKDTDIMDIYDGYLYRSFLGGTLLHDKNAVSLSANTDGVSLFESSRKSLWPLYSVINELPPQQRRQNIVLHSLWCGNDKPDFHSFLSHFVREITRLSTEGFTWVKEGAVVSTKVYLLTFGCDSPARCQMQNSKQFNGTMGCSWCTSRGTRLPDKNKLVYPFIGLPRLRTNEETRNYGEEALETGTVIEGIKGPACLADIIYFDVVQGFTVDAMHCVDLGVVRQLFNKLWFKSANYQERYYIGAPNTVKILDDAIARIFIPKEFIRVPRSFHDRCDWKAVEFKNFLFFYFPVLEGILPRPYFKHFALLSKAIYTLSRPLSQSDLLDATINIERFVQDFEKLYGVENMSFNVHQLLHLAECVSCWGPLCCYDAYGFENENGVLVTKFNGSQFVMEQIVENVLLSKMIQNYASKLDAQNNKVSKLMISMMSHKRETKKHVQVGRCTLFGNPSLKDFSDVQRELLRQFFPGRTVTSGRVFQRASINSRVFTTSGYKRGNRKKTCTSC